MLRSQSKLMIIFIVASTLFGCCAPTYNNDWVVKNGQALDRMAKALSEFGTVGMSAPLLVVPDERFKFDLPPEIDTKKYFDDAKSELQGRAAALEQNVSIAAMGASLQLDPTQMSAYSDLLKQYQLNRLSYLHSQSERERLLAMKQNAQETAAKVKLKADLDAANALTEPQQSQKIAEAYQSYSDTIKIPDVPTAPTYPTAPKDGSDVPAKASGGPTGAAQSRSALSGDGKLAANLGLLGTSPTVTTSNRSALITAAGDTAVHAIFSALGQPHKAQKFEGKKTLFGVTMVSVEPGWRTKEDFAAHLTVRPELEWKLARVEVARNVKAKCSDDLKPYVKVDGDDFLKNTAPSITIFDLEKRADGQNLSLPKSSFEKYSSNHKVWYVENPKKLKKDIALVTAVSPMTESQNLQLSDSLRSRTERALQFALALRYMGLGLDTNSFFEQLKQFEKDILTRNQQVAVSAFSTGNQFGYQIGPILWGMGDTTSDNPDPTYKLTRQSFPALVLLGFDKDDLRPVLVCENCQKLIEKEGVISLEPRSEPFVPQLRVYEPYLKFSQIRRWIPLTEKAAKHALRDSDVIGMDYAAYEAVYFSCDNEQNDNGECNDKKYPGVADEIKQRGRSMTEELLGNSNIQALPLEYVVESGEPIITDVFPEEVQLNPTDVKGKPQTASFVYVGANLHQLDLPLSTSATEKPAVPQSSATEPAENPSVVQDPNAKVLVLTGNGKVTGASLINESMVKVTVDVTSSTPSELTLGFVAKDTNGLRVIARPVKLIKSPEGKTPAAASAGSKSADLPVVTGIYPSTIQLKKDAKGDISAPQVRTLAIVGSNLGGLSVDKGDVRLLGGMASITGVKLNKDTMEVTLNFTDASSPKYVLTPAVSVTTAEPNQASAITGSGSLQAGKAKTKGQ